MNFPHSLENTDSVRAIHLKRMRNVILQFFPLPAHEPHLYTARRRMMNRKFAESVASVEQFRSVYISRSTTSVAVTINKLFLGYNGVKMFAGCGIVLKIHFITIIISELLLSLPHSFNLLPKNNTRESEKTLFLNAENFGEGNVHTNSDLYKKLLEFRWWLWRT